MSARTTRCRRSISASRSPTSGTVGPPERDAGQRLVHMDAAVLLAVGVEPEDVVVREHRLDPFDDAAAFHLQSAEDAVEGDDQLGGAEAAAKVVERLDEIADEIHPGCGAKHEAVVDRREERQAPTWVR